MGKIITYKNAGIKGVYSQIQLDSGERVLISIAANEVKILKLIALGMIPSKTIWQHSDLYKLTKLLKDKDDTIHPLDMLINKIKNFNSIKELQNGMDKFINK